MAELSLAAAPPEIAAGPPPLSPSSIVTLRPFFCRQEGEEYLIGQPDSSTYLSVPQLGVDVLSLLNEGRPVDAVARQLRDDDGDYPDVLAFVETLIEHRMVAAIDGVPLRAPAPPPETRGVAVLGRIRGAYVAWLFTPAALLVHGLALLATVALLARYTEYIPRSSHFFVHPSFTLNTLLLVLTALTLMFLHELGHVFAARAVGIDGRLNVSHRLLTPVAECILDDIWQVARPQRLIIYSAGLIVNVWVFLAALLALLLWGPSLTPMATAWLQLILLLELYSSAWQFRLYMRTDIYYIVADLVRAKNLMADTTGYLCSKLARVLPQCSCHANSLGDLPLRERRFVKLYSLLFVAGVGVTLALLAAYVIPFYAHTIRSALAIAVQGTAAGTGQFVDALTTLVIYVGSLVLLGVVLWRERLRPMLA